MLVIYLNIIMFVMVRLRSRWRSFPILKQIYGARALSTYGPSNQNNKKNFRIKVRVIIYCASNKSVPNNDVPIVIQPFLISKTDLIYIFMNYKLHLYLIVNTLLCAINCII